MRKSFLIFILLLCCCCCFATDIHTFFSTERYSELLPMDKDLGQCVSYDASQTHQFLRDALNEPYDYEWTEKYLHPDFKISLSSVYSSLFSGILPSNQLIFSKAKQNQDGSIIVSVKFLESQKIVTFVVFDQKISAILE